MKQNGEPECDLTQSAGNADDASPDEIQKAETALIAAYAERERAREASRAADADLWMFVRE